MNLIVTDRANLLSDYAPIQPALNSPSAKLGFDGAIGIVNRKLVLVDTGCNGCIGFFLLDVAQPITSAEAFQLGSKGKNSDLNEVLIVGFAHVGILLQYWVIAHNNRPHLFTFGDRSASVEQFSSATWERPARYT
ncbi:hypothetical protein [Oscillatoria salina]|uniref:hypothetical protein n=1 Tax=Oscillatoria salina TaxID=331517 RepID=UPI0013B8529C|nr:hypothetical protein [Oscillatoria salina]MBZ8181261.1 hypothetical protein [Oscillatoria salina IIICB1]NET90409.1 hypothetical protein [Kamptonema sp. SIO1D9]